MYWFIIFSLLLIPITNSFFIGVKRLVQSFVINYERKGAVSKLTNENQEIRNKIEYYKSSKGIKTLVKDRLNKVDEGEIIIKFDKEKS